MATHTWIYAVNNHDCTAKGITPKHEKVLGFAAAIFPPTSENAPSKYISWGDEID